MTWVLVFVGIALLGLVGLVGYAIWLWHKAEDVLSEVEMVGRQAEEMLGLLDEIAPIEPSRAVPGHSPVREDDEDDVRSHQAALDFEPDYYPGGRSRVRH